MSIGHSQTSSPRFLSAAEQTVARALEQALPEGFHIEERPAKIAVQEGDGAGFSYQPDFVARDSATGKSFIFEVKTPSALSLANELKFRSVSSAYKEQGDEFVLLVLGTGTSDVSRKTNIQGQGIRTLWVQDSGEAAQALKALLSKLRVGLVSKSDV